MRGPEKKALKAGEEITTAYQSPPVEAASTPLPAAEMTPLTGEGRRSRDYYRKVADLSIQAAEALDHAHQLGIVHRDIKPANLMLDSRGNVWVTDFGLAHVQHGEASLTGTGQIVGTPRYMSPEQALAKRVPINHRTDVYSLGVTLYELLTLQPAFGSEDRHELLRQITSEEPARPRRLERTIPAELEIIVLKAMEKRPQDRFATAQELADDLERWLRNEPIRARRPTLIQRASKWVRRHKPATTAGMVVLLMALMLAGYIGLTRQERALRREASEKAIRTAMESSHESQKKRRMPEALLAAWRAEGLLNGEDVEESLKQLVRARVDELEMVGRLENILLENQTELREGQFDYKGTDALFEQTFRDAGVDVESLSAEEAAKRIRASTVTAELASMLDNWAIARRKARG